MPRKQVSQENCCHKAGWAEGVVSGLQKFYLMFLTSIMFLSGQIKLALVVIVSLPGPCTRVKPPECRAIAWYTSLIDSTASYSLVKSRTLKLLNIGNINSLDYETIPVTDGDFCCSNAREISARQDLNFQQIIIRSPWLVFIKQRFDLFSTFN